MQSFQGLTYSRLALALTPGKESKGILGQQNGESVPNDQPEHVQMLSEVSVQSFEVQVVLVAQQDAHARVYDKVHLAIQQGRSNHGLQRFGEELLVHVVEFVRVEVEGLHVALVGFDVESLEFVLDWHSVLGSVSQSVEEALVDYCAQVKARKEDKRQLPRYY